MHLFSLSLASRCQHRTVAHDSAWLHWRWDLLSCFLRLVHSQRAILVFVVGSRWIAAKWLRKVLLAVFSALLDGRHAHKVVLIFIWNQYFLVSQWDSWIFFAIS